MPWELSQFLLAVQRKQKSINNTSPNFLSHSLLKITDSPDESIGGKTTGELRKVAHAIYRSHGEVEWFPGSDLIQLGVCYLYGHPKEIANLGLYCARGEEASPSTDESGRREAVWGTELTVAADTPLI